jgi:hypothetical protein
MLRISLECIAMVAMIAASARADTIISDTFADSDGTVITSHTADANLTGNAWQVNGQPGYQGYVYSGSLRLGASTGAAIGIASAGSYVKPTALTLSASLKISGITGTDQACRGVGLGFFASLVSGATAGVGTQNFYGLVLGTDGALKLVESVGTTQTLLESVAWSGVGGAAFSATTAYTLSYTVDITTHKITDISLSGSNADFSAILNDANGVFTDANTAYAGVVASSKTGSVYGYIDNFSVASVPEPGTTMLFGIGATGLLAYVLWKRKRKN